jgi:ATP-dependent exoDNAse (exonuclease V) beta subunit
MIDLLSFDGQDWWLLDYKTSRPAAGEDWEAFITQETEKYRPQLAAYREMAARARGIEPPERLRLALYFTACRKVVEM